MTDTSSEAVEVNLDLVTQSDSNVEAKYLPIPQLLPSGYCCQRDSDQY